MRARRDQSLGLEDPLEEGMAAHSSILACRIPWTEEPGELCICSPWGHKELDMTEVLEHIGMINKLNYSLYRFQQN